MRIRVAGGLAAVLIGLLVPSASAGTPELLPDLIVRKATGLDVRVLSGGRRRLRFTTWAANVGVGVVELDPRKDDCDGDGDLEDDRTALQRTFFDANGNGRYDPPSDLEHREREVGCFVFHAKHRHWHFENFARYRLIDPGTRQVLSRQAKVGFCVVDNHRWRADVPGSPVEPYYTSCRPDRVQGLSPGWADVYPAFLAAQWLDVTGLDPGRYCLIQRIDPGDVLEESDEADNLSRTAIRLAKASATARKGSC